MNDLRKLDLNLLVIFEEIYTAGNISHAARRLGLSQPTISNSLTRLRGSLDDQLFTRGKRGVVPTPRAEQLIGPVREALQAIKSGVAEIDEFDPATTKRNFRMVLLDQLEPILIPPIVRDIQAYRSITLETLPIANTSVAEGLSDGSLDIALSTFVSDLEEMHCEAIGSANVVMVARKNHPAIDNEITMELFESLGHMALPTKLRAMSRLDEFLKHKNISRQIVYTVTKFWSFPHILAHTDLIAMLPGDFAVEAAKYFEIEIYPLPFELPEQQVYMTWKKAIDNDPAHIWLREKIRSAVSLSSS